ncbi:ANTH-domain-containing protein [Pisolithus croceorrhizus]|nr:ANTH-domain-containing protein [Pisolithus croceorrhizus]
MSSFDKVVKLACKPKAAPPKAKYLDPIIAATWSEDGAVYDVCKALIPRLREPNAIVVFKALIVLHTMIRNGSTDNVLSHLSSSEVLRLRNISAGNNWEGYHAPQNLQHYALYLDSRIRAFRELKHDAIRVQSETNRDMRVNNSIEEDMAYTTAPKSSSTRSKGPQRSKTIMGRKLRMMTVEKGLLRETKTVQKMIDSLVECRFYLDDLEDELTTTALRMLVKDLLILFQACNEGVINVLEHYFEMSKHDAKDALSIYRHFSDQTERVMEYLGVAKKLQNLLNVSIPNLKHAPVSLASSLEEYLNDPNFEQNRIEYKASKEATARNGKPPNGTSSSSAPPHKGSLPQPGPTPSTSSSMTVSSAPSGLSSKGDVNAIPDLLNSIEEEQPAANPPSSSVPIQLTNVPQPVAHNPFVQRQMTGGFPTQSPNFPPQLQMQPTGFQVSQPFLHGQQAFQPVQSHQHAPQHRPFSTFLQPQATGFQPAMTGGFLQPQATGANPFRQSMLLPQATGMAAFNIGTTSPFTAASQPAGQMSPHAPFQGSQAFGLPAQAQQPASASTAGAQIGSRNTTDVPARPASTPLTTFGATQPSSTSPPVAQPVKTHQTGSRNPFGIPVSPAPPVPKPPTLLELSTGTGKFTVEGNQFMAPQPQPTSTASNLGAGSGAAESSISSVASSFTFSKEQEHSSGPSSGISNGVGHTAGTTNMTGATSFTSQTSSIPVPPIGAPLKPQATGLAGLKPFKPTSSFGAALLESLPPIPQSTAATPDVTGVPGPTHTSTPSLPTTLALSNSSFSANPTEGAIGSLTSQPTGMLSTFPRHDGGSTVGVGLRPQATGTLGAANPFRATMFATSPTSTTNSLALPSNPGLGIGLGGNNALSAGFGPGDPNALKAQAGPSLI